MIILNLPQKNIYIYDACNNKRSLIQNNGKCYEVAESQYRTGVKQDEESVVLIDTGCGDVVKSISYAGFVVVISSTNAIASRMYIPMFLQKYLSVWSWEEVRGGYQIWISHRRQSTDSKIDWDAEYTNLERKYQYVGGVVEHLFCSKRVTDWYITEVHISIRKAVVDFIPNISLSKHHHKIMHIRATKNSEDFEYVFATERVLHELVGQHILLRD